MTLVCASVAVSSAEPKRDLPDYDGRGNVDTKSSSALWVPRIILAPLYAVHEFVIRQPLGWLVRTADRGHWQIRIRDFFILDAEHNVMLYPTAMFDFGLLPSVGASLTADDVVLTGNHIKLHAATWGVDWLVASGLDRKGPFTTLVDFSRRSDNLFVGTGPDVTSATRSRYGAQLLDASEAVALHLSGESVITLALGARTARVRGGTCCGDPNLDERINNGMLPALSALDRKHTSVYQRAALRLDSRAVRPARGSGLFLDLHGVNHVGVDRDADWLRYGADVGGALDLNGRQRTLKLLVGVELVDPLRGGEVPFDELAQLGGEDSMAGFLPGWMNGRSTVVTSLSYSWPIWVWLDGETHVSVGNAFDQHFEGIEAKKLRLSVDFGVTSIDRRDTRFELLVGVGTETFEQGGHITSVRVAFGSREGF